MLVQRRLIAPLSNFVLNSGIATVIDGNAFASKIKEEIKLEVHDLFLKYQKPPGLAVVLVGDRKDSQSYVKNKKQTCKDLGMNSFGIDFPVDVSEKDLLSKIDELNNGSQ